MPAKQNVSPIDRALAGVLKGAYTTRGLTQEELTELTGIKKTTVQRLMAGKSSFEVEQLFALADAIGWKTARDYMLEAEELLKKP